jgi:glycosyltransferase involved in cell wall biosynthesis
MTTVSVLLPARDAAPYLREAIDSVLRQTMPDFELIVVDDASSDATPEVLASIDDPRLRVVRNDAPLGIAGALGRGLALCRGRFIARMDADDLCAPQRFAMQLAWLDAHRDAGACGSWVRMFCDGWQRDRRLESDPERIRCALLLFNTMSDPSAMLRRELVEEVGYDPSFVTAADYDFWARANRRCRLGNVRALLLHYRVHGAQIGGRRPLRVAEADRIRRAQLEDIGVALTPEEEALHHSVGRAELPPSLDAAASWMEKIVEAKDGFCDRRVLRAVLSEQLLLAVGRNAPRLLGRVAALITPRTIVSFATRRFDDRRRETNRPA